MLWQRDGSSGGRAAIDSDGSYALSDVPAGVRGPFAQHGGPSNIRTNGVNVWLASPGLNERMPEFDRRGHAALRGLAPGRYRIVALPDDLTFVPAEFEVGAANTSVTLEWRRR